jgi:hypothetical protein
MGGKAAKDSQEQPKQRRVARNSDVQRRAAGAPIRRMRPIRGMRRLFLTLVRCVSLFPSCFSLFPTLADDKGDL